MDRRELERAAVSYAHLRGLLLIPIGALLVLSALANAEEVPTWTFPAGLVVGAVVCLLIVRHYRERYGHVRASARQQTRDAIAIALAIVIVIAASVLLRDAPVNPIAIAFAIALAVGYALGAGLRAHQLAILGALLAIGLLPVWDGDESANAGLALAGVAISLTGILDHRAFVHVFGPPADA
jgi:hypothetical protein